MNPRPGRVLQRLGAWLCLCCPLPGLGQTPPTPQRIEVQAPALGAADERRLAVGLTTIVGREELDAWGDTSVLDVLQRSPGIDIDGDQPRLRGLGGGYTQILLNGEPAPPGFSLEQLAPGDIERIEILRGPSAEFGGVAGTINVILRAPPKLRQREWRAQASYRSDRPVGSTQWSWGDRVGKVSLHLPLSAYQWAGANRSRVERLTRDPGGEVREDRVLGQDRWHGGGLHLGPRVDYEPGQGHRLQWHGFAQAHDSGNGNHRRTDRLQGPALDVVDESTRAHSHWRLLRSQLQWHARSAGAARLETRLGGERSEWRNQVETTGLPGEAGPRLRESRAQVDASRRWAAARLRVAAGDDHALVLGWDFERRHRSELRRSFEQGQELLSPSLGLPFEVSWWRQVVFVQDEWVWSPRGTASLGLRGEALRIRSALPGRESRSADVLWSPVLQARWALDAKGQQLLRAAVSRSTRLPDIGQLMARHVLNAAYDRWTTNTPLAPDSAGNPALRAERAWALEAAAERHGAGAAVFSAGLFYRAIEGLIRRRVALESVPEALAPRWVSRPVNLGRAWSAGVEIEAKGRADGLLQGLVEAGSPLQLRASLSAYRSRVAQVDDPDARLEGQPPWRLTLGFDRKGLDPLPGFGASLAYTPGFATQQTDLQRVFRASSRRIDAYLAGRIDAQVQWRVSVQQAWPRESRTQQQIDDREGSQSMQQLWRPVQTLFNASLVWRY